MQWHLATHFLAIFEMKICCPLQSSSSFEDTKRTSRESIWTSGNYVAFGSWTCHAASVSWERGLDQDFIFKENWWSIKAKSIWDQVDNPISLSLRELWQTPNVTQKRKERKNITAIACGFCQQRKMLPVKKNIPGLASGAPNCLLKMSKNKMYKEMMVSNSLRMKQDSQ